MDAALPQPAGLTESKNPSFGIASIVFAVLTVVLPVVLVAFFSAQAKQDTTDPAHFWGPLGILVAGGVLAVLAAGISALAGAISGGIALARRERSSWLAVVGLIVNVPVTLFVLYLILMVQVNQGG